MYYDTTSPTTTELSHRHIIAENQETKILAYFQLRPATQVSPSQVHAACFTDQTPITSVRRAINTLTKKGNLLKLCGKTIGIYGHAEHYWILNPGFDKLTGPKFDKLTGPKFDKLTGPSSTGSLSRPINH